MTNQPTSSQRLHERLRELIATTKPGERLLSEPYLARELGVSRATLREAMRTFEIQGLIRRRQGAGTYVMHPSQVIETGLEVLESIETLAERIGLKVSKGEVVISRRSPTPEESRVLSLPSSETMQVVYVARVILAEGRPVAYLIDIVPEQFLKVIDLDEQFSGSILDILLTQGGLDLTSSRCEINAVTATAEVARALQIQRGDVLLRFEALLYAANGQVVDYSFSYFLPGVFRFHVVRKVG
jgi:GntR family transcriptional regulator